MGSLGQPGIHTFLQCTMLGSQSKVVVTSAVGAVLQPSGRDPLGLKGFLLPPVASPDQSGLRVVTVTGPERTVRHKWFSLAQARALRGVDPLHLRRLVAAPAQSFIASSPPPSPLLSARVRRRSTGDLVSEKPPRKVKDVQLADKAKAPGGAGSSNSSYSNSSGTSSRPRSLSLAFFS
mmetsp:Transcript_23635/g.53307  ORF Transcript_23635/g.53307 Transcript_23635/m.53307 type:complete len:178 (-) Transcript_23635:107-640(-)